MSIPENNNNRTYLRIIVILSIVIPVLVATLLYTPLSLGMGSWVRILPGLNAVINSLTAVVLMVSLFAIKRKKITLHRNLMLFAISLGAVFLVSYVLYHSNSDSTVFGDLDHNGLLDTNELAEVSSFRGVYLFILLSHIAFSIIVVPLVLLSAFFSLTNQIERHRKVVKLSFPIWFYVSVTGVVVYLMISPYYN